MAKLVNPIVAYFHEKWPTVEIKYDVKSAKCPFFDLIIDPTTMTRLLIYDVDDNVVDIGLRRRAKGLVIEDEKGFYVQVIEEDGNIKLYRDLKEIESQQTLEANLPILKKQIEEKLIEWGKPTPPKK